MAAPTGHPLAGRKSIPATLLKTETMLLLGTGHCFRDQVLEVCPELSRYSQASAGIQKTFEGSSLETIRHMVASGIGITVLPWTAMPPPSRRDRLLRYVPFDDPPPVRRVTIAWRKSYARAPAVAKIRNAVLKLKLAGVTMLPNELPIHH